MEPNRPYAIKNKRNRKQQIAILNRFTDYTLYFFAKDIFTSKTS